MPQKEEDKVTISYENWPFIARGNNCCRFLIDVGNKSTALGIQFDSAAPTVGELKQTISQWVLVQQNKKQSMNQYCTVYFTHETPFYSMSDSDTINWNVLISNHATKVCVLRMDVHFQTAFSIRQSAMHTQNFNGDSQKDCCHFIDTNHPSILQCPILSPILKIHDKNGHKNYNGNSYTNYNNMDMIKYSVNYSKLKALSVNGIASIKDHLSYYQHFYPLFHFSRAICDQGESCPILKKLLLTGYFDCNVKGLTDLEQIHIKLFKHISIARNNEEKTRKKKQKYFEFVKNEDAIQSEKPTKTLMQDVSDVIDKNIEYLRVFGLIIEVITNGYEKDLSPKDLDDEIETKFDDQESKQTHAKRYRLMVEIFEKDEFDFQMLHDMLHDEYGIMDHLDALVDHPRHVLFKKPLYLYELLALYLYCNGDCNYDLSKTLRNNNFTKWKLFDRWLAVAIDKMARWQRYTDNTNIYSGMVSVIIDKKDIPDDNKPLYMILKCYQSFSTSLDEAKIFAGSDGMIIGLNLSKWKNCGQTTPVSQLTAIKACDVSWLSNYKNEKEILVSRSNVLIIWKRNIVQVGNYQCVLCCDNVLNCHAVSVETMFFNK